MFAADGPFTLARSFQVGAMFSNDGLSCRLLFFSCFFFPLYFCVLYYYYYYFIIIIILKVYPLFFFIYFFFLFQIKISFDYLVRLEAIYCLNSLCR